MPRRGAPTSRTRNTGPRRLALQSERDARRFDSEDVGATVLRHETAKHRDEQARVRILLSHGRDARSVEREMRQDADIEEVDWLSDLVDERRALPDRPAVVVPRGREGQRVVPSSRLGPRAGEVAGEIG